MSFSTPPTHLVLFGRPGCGKSSVAERLCEDYGFKLIRTGELLRAAVRRDDFLGRRVSAHLADGTLVPDRLILELLEHTLQAPGSERLLFDGFPRTIGQVPLLEQFERDLGFRIECYLDLHVSREEAESRMTGRRVCPVCGATYHIKASPPKVAEHCDHDGARLEGRKDDRLEVVRVRQDLYDEQTKPLIDYYQTHASDRFVVVNGDNSPSPDFVYAEVIRALHLDRLNSAKA
ncbi:MAG TPA: nucleoside monophosphate kinase [Isosphaeraceae bacterium]|nr:nucleoside monophosphate kinase [Isosphaeraceae bacterium]